MEGENDKGKATAKFWMIVHPKEGLLSHGGIWPTEKAATQIMETLGGAPLEKLRQKGWRVAKVWFEEMG